MIKRFLPVLLIAFFAPFLTAYSAAAEKLKVAASIFPLGSIVQEIGGDEVEVFTLLAKNVSPHVYEPAPKDVIRLRESRAFFLVGLGLEPWAEKLVQGKTADELRIVKTGEFFLHAGEEVSHEEHEDADGHRHGDVNPHIWLSTEYAGKIAEVVRQVLTELKPESKEAFLSNYRGFLAELAALEGEIRELRQSISGKDVRIITFHDSFLYFFEALQLKQIKAIEPFPGKKPSLKRLKDLVDFMQGGEVKAVFTEPQFSGRMTEVVVAETGAQKGLLDPIGCPSCNERTGYIPLMRYNLQQVRSLVNRHADK